jgi:PAS domain S-box-containing protein
MLQKLSRHTDASLRLQEISTLLIQEGNLDALYKRVLDAAIGLMSADMGTMQKYDPESGELLLLSAKGEFHPEAAAFWERVNRATATTCGMALSLERRVIVPDVESSDFMAGTADLDALRRSSIRAAQSTPLVSRSGQLLGMISTHWREPHQPTERRLRSLDVLARQAADLIERIQVETALRESEQRLRWLASIVESSNDPIVSTSIERVSTGFERVITTWNGAAERLFGYASDEVIGRPIAILYPPDRHDEQRTIFRRIMAAERIENYETVRLRKDGSSVDVSLTISAVKDAEGKIAGASAIYRDITRRKRAEEREKILMAELDHRVKNVLSRVDMVLMSSRHGSTSIDEFTRSVKGRIQSMAAAHYLLSQKGWRGVGLEALVRNQLAPYASHANVAIHGADIILAPVAIQAMGMVLHELVTNAAKYGAFSVPTGSVAVSWERRSNGHAANLVFTWRELGGPAVAVAAKSGYGTRLIRELVPHELRGTVDLEFATEGVSCRIEFPLSK